MEETLAFQKMAEIDLINNLEKISSEIPNRIIKLEGFTLKENHKEQLEIIIFKGFSSSTTHPIEINVEKKGEGDGAGRNLRSCRVKIFISKVPALGSKKSTPKTVNEAF